MPEELWTEVLNTVQGAVTKTIPKKKNARRQNGCLRGNPLQIAEKRREKQKRKRKIYPTEYRVPKAIKER